MGGGDRETAVWSGIAISVVEAGDSRHDAFGAVTYVPDKDVAVSASRHSYQSQRLHRVVPYTHAVGGVHHEHLPDSKSEHGTATRT